MRDALIEDTVVEGAAVLFDRRGVCLGQTLLIPERQIRDSDLAKTSCDPNWNPLSPPLCSPQWAGLSVQSYDLSINNTALADRALSPHLRRESLGRKCATLLLAYPSRL